MNSSLLNALLALAATMLALSILVQIIQEVYKFLSSSKERSYTNALLDFLGPWAKQILSPGQVMKLQIRGPIQWFRFQPKQRLLPMKCDELTSALESTAPTWVRQTLERLRMEADFQNGKDSSPSPNWLEFLKELGNVEKGSPGYWSASQISDFLVAYGHSVRRAPSSDNSERGQAERLGTISFKESQQWNAGEILKSFQHRFLPHIVRAGDHFDQLQRNFEYQYKRRNLRQTFLIALILTLLFNLSIQKLYRYAKAVPPDEAAALAERSLRLFQQYQETSQTSSSGKKNGGVLIDEQQLKEMVSISREILKQSQGVEFSLVDSGVLANVGAFAGYLFGCFMTALFLSFGAPIWNDATSALLNLQKGKKQERFVAPREDSNG